MILVHLSVEEIKKHINKNDLTEEYLLWLEKATQHLDDCAICRKRVQEAILIEEMCEENNIADVLKFAAQEEDIRKSITELKNNIKENYEGKIICDRNMY